MQMEYKRILCAYLDHTPNGIRDPNRQILMTLLANCYSAEDLARDIVASIIRQVRSIVEEERSDLSPDVIVNYWYEVAATSHSPSATSTSFHAIAQAYHASSTPRRNNRISPSFGSIPGTSGLLTGSGHSDPQPTPKPTARHHENPDVDRILSQAYNDIGFTWTTDFLLYPLGKRASQLIPRIRGAHLHPGSNIRANQNTHHSVRAIAGATTSTVSGAASGASGVVAGAAEATRMQGGQSPPYVPVPVYNAFDDSQDGERPAKRRRLDVAAPRHTPGPSFNNLEQLSTVSMMVRDSENNVGLDGCKYINDLRGMEITPYTELSQSTIDHWARYDQALDLMLPSEVTEIFHSINDSVGEALYNRLGKNKGQLKQDIIRRDGAACAASREQGPLFCTQIIPESNDLGRFTRFRKMVSTYFKGYYDSILEPTSSSSTVGIHTGSGSPISSPSNQAAEYRAKRRGHYPTSTNVLQSPRNAFNLSEKWLRWFDEGRFVLQECGGRYQIKCLDPTLYHDPSFSRLNHYGNIESGHGLELDIGATRMLRQMLYPNTAAPSSTSTTGVTLPSIAATLNQTTSSLDVSLPPIATSSSSITLKQLPTPMATPPTFNGAGSSQSSVATAVPAQGQSVRGAGAGLGVGPAHRGSRSLWTVRSRAGRGDSSKSNRSSPLPPSSSSEKTDRGTQRSQRPHQIQNPSPSSSLIVKTAEKVTEPTPIVGARMGAPIVPVQANATSGSSNAHNNTNVTRIPSSSSSGVVAKQASTHSRNSSGSSSTSSRHSLSALLNPSIATPTASSAASTPLSSSAPTTPTRTATPSTSAASPSSLTAVSSLTPNSASTAPSSASIPNGFVRKEIWDVDALDPNLVRLHEQIVATWWATGFAPQLGSELAWVESVPLEEANIFSLGPRTFADLLMHKLRIL